MHNENWDKRKPRRLGAGVDPLRVDRLPPHSPEAEMGVLGCCLLDPACVALSWDRFGTDEVFYDLRHQTIFSVMAGMSRRREAIDLITVQQQLKNKQLLEQVGGIAYVSALPDTVPSAANLRYYVDIVREKWELRRMLRLCTEVVGRIYEHESSGDDLEFFKDTVREDLGNVLDGERRHFPSFEDASVIIERNTPEPDRVVEHLLHVGQKLCIGGGSKSCKTWALMDLALCVSLGIPWLDLPTRQNSVLFINFEIPSVFFEHRLRKIASHKMVTINRDMFHVWNLRGIEAPYTSLLPELEKRLARMANPPRFVVFDPIYKMYADDADENSANDSRKLLSGIESVCVRSGAAAAYSHHYTKGNQASKASIDRISGSGVFSRDPDSLLMFTGHAEPDAFTVEGTLRNFCSLVPFAVRWTYPVFKRDDVLDPNDLKQAPKAAGAKKRRKTEEDLFATIPLPPALVTKDTIVSKRPDGMSERDARGFIDALLASGKLFEHRVKRHRMRDEVKMGRHQQADEQELEGMQ